MTTDVAAICAGLTKAQREAIIACRKRATGGGGERWDFASVRTGTRKALIRMGVASPWGVVSASLTPLGLSVRAALQQNDEGASTPPTPNKDEAR